jgi:hypothetical protein
MKPMNISLGERGIPRVALHAGWVRADLDDPNADIEPPQIHPRHARTILKTVVQRCRAFPRADWKGEALLT